MCFRQVDMPWMTSTLLRSTVRFQQLCCTACLESKPKSPRLQICSPFLMELLLNIVAVPHFEQHSLVTTDSELLWRLRWAVHKPNLIKNQRPLVKWTTRWRFHLKSPGSDSSHTQFTHSFDSPLSATRPFLEIRHIGISLIAWSKREKNAIDSLRKPFRNGVCVCSSCTPLISIRGRTKSEHAFRILLRCDQQMEYD